jgi:hypothetical protein
MNEEQPIAGSIFKYEAWDDDGQGNMHFYNIRLKIDVGEFLAGTLFDACFMDFEKSIISFYELYEDGQQSEYSFKLNLTIGGQISWLNH